MKSEEDKRIEVHEYWMAFRRRYHKIKEGHRPKITHEEVEEMIYQIMTTVGEKVDSLIPTKTEKEK